MAELKWKNGKVLTVRGTMARPGVYKSNSGKQVEFTPRLVSQIFTDTNKPYETHLSHENREVGGFGKIGYNSSSDTLEYCVNVYNPKHIEQILYDGVNKVSPEIDFDYDEATGLPIGGKVSGIAFVTHPKIDGTQATEMNVQHFGEMDMKYKLVLENGEYKFIPDVENFGELGMQPVVGAPNITNVGVSQSGITTPAMPAPVSTAPVAGTTAQPAQPNIVINMPEPKEPATPTGASLAPTAENDEFKAKYNALLQTQVATVANELKAMGIPDPDAIGKDMTAEQRLGVLKAIKENYVKSAPGVMTTNTQMGGGSNPAPNKQEQIAKTMKEAGIDPKRYMKYFEGDN
jgi:hypothetical protein